MMNQLFAATRKGLFRIEITSKGASTKLIGFEGDPVVQVFCDQRDGSLFASLDLGHFGPKLQRSPDGGASWEEVSVPSYPRRGKQPASLKQIWCLEAAGDAPGELWAGTIPGGLFHSKDAGQSWTLNKALWNRKERKDWFGGGFDDPGIHSVCVNPRDTKQVTLGVSCGGVWASKDGGQRWRMRTKGMFADYVPPKQRKQGSIQDPHRIVQSPSHPGHFWCQHHNGIFRSRDGLGSWEHISGVEPSDFGFAVCVHPKKPNSAWFVPAKKDECRIPVHGKLAVSRTRDGGRSFETLRNGLPQKHAYDLVFRHAMDIDDTGERLAIGSTTGGLWLTRNGGDRWKRLHANLPPIYALRFA